MNDIIALDQRSSLFSPRKATRMSPKFSAKYGICHFQYTNHVISFSLTSGKVQLAIRLVHVKNQYVVEDTSR